MTNVKTLIDAAFSRSTFNDRNIATNSELVGVVDRRMKQLYSLAARNNPYYFGKALDVPYSAVAEGWIRPVDAEMVMALTYADGTEINIVPFFDRIGEMPPRVYEFGQVYKSVGQPADPAAETLSFFYSKRHPDLDANLPPTNVANQLDASWPEQFNDLIVLHLARYLAVKDQRAEESTLFVAEENALMDVFLKHLAHENYGMKSRWNQRPVIRGEG